MQDREHSDASLSTRVALLEAKVRLIALVMKGFIALLVGSLVTYLINKFT